MAAKWDDERADWWVVYWAGKMVVVLVLSLDERMVVVKVDWKAVLKAFHLVEMMVHSME